MEFFADAIMMLLIGISSMFILHKISFLKFKSEVLSELAKVKKWLSDELAKINKG